MKILKAPTCVALSGQVSYPTSVSDAPLGKQGIIGLALFCFIGFEIYLFVSFLFFLKFYKGFSVCVTLTGLCPQSNRDLSAGIKGVHPTPILGFNFLFSFWFL